MWYLIKKITCIFIGHDWYIIDYFYGMECNTTWNIKECGRCYKAELD